MSDDLIPKSDGDASCANMTDYALERAAFSWERATGLLDGLPDSKLNIAYEVRVPLFANLDVVGKFDNTVDLSGRPSQ